ncbi:MAG TPA: NAD(P)-dependent oxidoreductase [Kofleriaceae bacterium]|nr:NAD(P)-dependent oxidoreductase [Kofleriaceae bacterium]
MRLLYLDPSTASRDHARAALAALARIEFADADAPLDGRDYDVLVAARPTPRHLERGPRALVVPLAGLPDATREILREFPAIPVHLLHHNASAAAEMAIALLFAAAKDLVSSDAALRRGTWTTAGGLRRLAGTRVVVLGHGHLGRRVATACAQLGMVVDAVRRQPGARTDGPVTVHPREALAAVLDGAAAVIVCVPLTPATRGMLGDRELARLADDALIVNVGRAEVIDEAVLFDHLQRRPMLRAALDVWYREPEHGNPLTGVRPSRHAFEELPNVIMSPHRGWRVTDHEAERMSALSQLLAQFQHGDWSSGAIDVAAGY